MNMNDFLNMVGLGPRDAVSVNALELQNTLREIEELREYREIGKELGKSNIKLLEENKKLQYENDDMQCKINRLETSDKADINKLEKVNKKLLDQLKLSNMFLERRQERDNITTLTSGLNVDLRA